jgi:very-short-patch-repair endonuclease
MILKHWAALYTKPTSAELRLEPHIASLGVRYRFQHPVFAVGAILDFALPDHKLAIEVDGKSHFTKVGRIKDKARTARLNKLGWTIARTTNERVQAAPSDALYLALEEALAQNPGNRALEELLKLFGKVPYVEPCTEPAKAPG